MITKNCLVIPLAAIAITFSSEIALAVEKTNSSSSPIIWSLVALAAVVLFFGKQLFADAFPKSENIISEELTEDEVPVEVAVIEPQVTESTENTVVKAPDTSTKINQVTDAVEKVTDTVEIKSIDLKDGRKRCQAVTAKGTRCKRKINLEDASITIDGIDYQLTICLQHKANNFKPFPKLLK